MHYLQLKPIPLIIFLLIVSSLAGRAQVIDTVCADDPYGNYGVIGFSTSTYQWSVVGGQIISANGQDSVSIEWDATSPQHEVSVVEISDQGCLGDTINALIEVAPTPIADFLWTPDPPKPGDQVQLLSGNNQASFYQWDVDGNILPFQANQAYYTFLSSGIYNVTLTVKNSYGCTNSITKTVELRDNNNVNTFSPNGDGINDEWTIPNQNNNSDVEVYIYDRWGGRVFYSTQKPISWDGTFNGNEVPQGSYFYIIDYHNGKPPVKGVINIIR